MKQKGSKVNLHGSSERGKNNSDLVDKISALPDSILGLVLSFLPTKEVLRTSILSERWQFAWVTVHNLDFSYVGCWEEQNEDQNMKFVQFVNRVLALHDAGFLNKFSLVWRPWCISWRAGSWINTAITRNVHELSLYLVTRSGQFQLPISVPTSVFSCNSLQSLELNGGIYVSASTVVCLPRLESLTLDAIDFECEEAFEKLISGCPMLHYLHLHMYRNDSFTFLISSSSLRHLQLWFESGCSLKLNASLLEYLQVVGWISEIFVQKSLGTLVEAVLDFDYLDHSKDMIVEATRAFDCAKALWLSSDAMQAFGYAAIKLSTEFKRLVELETKIFYYDFNSLLDFIQGSDNLEVLTIYQRPNYPDSSPDQSHWKTPIKVPRCMSNSLKKVVFDGYEGSEDEHEMIHYMLKHGSALEVMKITYDSFMKDSEKLELVEEICKFSERSSVCEVEFEFSGR